MAENGTTPSVYCVYYRGSDALSRCPCSLRGKALWYNKIADAGDRPREGKGTMTWTGKNEVLDEVIGRAEQRMLDRREPPVSA